MTPHRKSSHTFHTEAVTGLWDYFTKSYGTRVVNRHDSNVMQWAGKMLDIVGIMDADVFLDSYATTVGYDVYVPFDIQSPEDPWGKILICVHEHQHVIQYNEDDTQGVAQFSARYITSPRWRTRYEVEAYTTQMEMEHWLTGNVPPIEPILETLRAYQISGDNLLVAQRTLAANAKIISQGGYLTEATKIAISWLGNFSK